MKEVIIRPLGLSGSPFYAIATDQIFTELGIEPTKEQRIAVVTILARHFECRPEVLPPPPPMPKKASSG